MKKFLLSAEYVFTVLSLLHYTAGPLAVILNGGASEEPISIKTQSDNSLIWLLFVFNYAVSLFLLIGRWKTTIYLFRKDKFIWVLVGLAMFSILWSSSPEMTLRRGIALVGSTAFAFYLATRYSLKQLVELLGWTFGIAVLLSFVFVIALPKYGIMGGVHTGVWRGIYPHKNTLGKTMVPSAIVFLLLAMDNKSHRLILQCGFIFTVLLLLLSTSKTSLTNLISLLAVFPIYQTFRWRYEIMIPAFIAITTVGGSFSILLMTDLDKFAGLIGKDATFTGRTDIWSAVLDRIQQHPWLGYGYSGFWSGDWKSEAAYVWYATGWMAPNSHNGFLDLLLDLGLLGMLIFLMGFWKNLVRGLAWIRLSKTSVSIFPLMYFTYIILANLAENTLLVQNDIFWVLYVATSLIILSPPESSKNTLNLSKGAMVL